MNNKRKIILFDALVEHILDDAEYNALSECEVESIFLAMGFTKAEYKNEIMPIFLKKY